MLDCRHRLFRLYPDYGRYMGNAFLPRDYLRTIATPDILLAEYMAPAVQNVFGIREVHIKEYQIDTVQTIN